MYAIPVMSRRLNRSGKIKLIDEGNCELTVNSMNKVVFYIYKLYF